MSKYPMSYTDSKCVPNHEVFRPADRKNSQRRERMRPRMRLRVYFLHHVRGSGEMSDGEEEDDWGRGYPVCDVDAGVR